MFLGKLDRLRPKCYTDIARHEFCMKLDFLLKSKQLYYLFIKNLHVGEKYCIFLFENSCFILKLALTYSYIRI